jgi:hypothetical protein
MNEINLIKINEFRQLKKEIPRSRDYLVVGIDVAKNKHNAFFLQRHFTVGFPFIDLRT